MLLAEQLGQSEITVGNLKTIRDFTDVRDVVRAYRLILTKEKEGTSTMYVPELGEKFKI